MPTPVSEKRVSVSSLTADLGILTIANFLTLYFYINGSYSVGQVLLTYYIQTLLIVIFYYYRIRRSNASQIQNLLEGRTSLFKRYTTLYQTSQEQFFYLLVLLLPLAFVLFTSMYAVGNDAADLRIDYGSISYLSVGIACSIFLLHHIISYALTIWYYSSRRIDEITIPYKKLCIRVYTILAIIFLSPLIVTDGQNRKVFYAFIALKTILDIFLSGSYLLLKSIKNI